MGTDISREMLVALLQFISQHRALFDVVVRQTAEFAGIRHYIAKVTLPGKLSGSILMPSEQCLTIYFQIDFNRLRAACGVLIASKGEELQWLEQAEGAEMQDLIEQNWPEVMVYLKDYNGEQDNYSALAELILRKREPEMDKALPCV